MSEFNYRGKEFTNPVDMADYILKCDKEDKAKAEQNKQEKLKVEKEERVAELIKAKQEYTNSINNAYDIYQSTINLAKEKYMEVERKFCKDYSIGTITPCRSVNKFINSFFGL